MRNYLLYGIAGIAILVAIVFLFNNNKSDTSELKSEEQAEEQTKSEPTPKIIIDKSKSYTATLKTEKGDVVISLTADKTPITVNNFVSLAKKGFYNNTVFHRTIKGFMIQGGDPEGTGRGGPGYRFADEPFAGDYTRGTIAMANAGTDTNGSQFFIIHQDYDLPKNYVIFGKVISGMEVVDAIVEAPVKTNEMGENSTPETPVKILSVEIKEE